LIFTTLFSLNITTYCFSLPHHKTKKTQGVNLESIAVTAHLTFEPDYSVKQFPPGQIPTPTQSQHNGQRSHLGSSSCQPSPACWPMAQDVRLCAGVWGCEWVKLGRDLKSNWLKSWKAGIQLSFFEIGDMLENW